MPLKAFTMPKWGIEMSEGLVGEWMVVERQKFARGDVLALIETDKITNEIEAEADGRFARIIAAAGETVPVGALLGVLGEAEDDPGVDEFIAAFRPADTSFNPADDDPVPSAMPLADEPNPPSPEPATIPDDVSISPAARARAGEARLDVTGLSGTGRGGRIMLMDVDQHMRPETPSNLKGAFELRCDGMAFASPMARRLAIQLGVSLDGTKGTGPRGRICKEDVLSLTRQTSPLGAIAVVTMTPMRRMIARRLTESKQQIPHFYVRRRVRVDRLLAYRLSLERKVSVNDLLIRATALALIEVPALNVQVHGDEIHQFSNADIAVAVATQKGLLTPVLRGADTLALGEISVRTADLAERAKAGKLKQDEIDGGSFTLSNLGPFGVEQFDAIINPPQGAILAVGAARSEPIDDLGAIRIVPVLHLSLSCDHRAIDGADAARFLAVLAGHLEGPDKL